MLRKSVLFFLSFGRSSFQNRLRGKHNYQFRRGALTGNINYVIPDDDHAVAPFLKFRFLSNVGPQILQ